MKSLIFAACIVLSAPAMAVSDTCESMAEFAEAVMGARQRGVSMSALFSRVDNTISDDQLADLMKDIVVMAYRRHRLNDENNQKMVVADFRNYVHINCLDAKGDKDAI